MDIAIYSRISADKQDNQNQLSQLRAFARAQGWRIKREYVDIASGKNGDREQFKALFDSAPRREYYHLHGRAIRLPRESDSLPSHEYLAFHDSVFRLVGVVLTENSERERIH
jgi:hypothetical protein